MSRIRTKIPDPEQCYNKCKRLITGKNGGAKENVFLFAKFLAIAFDFCFFVTRTCTLLGLGGLQKNDCYAFSPVRAKDVMFESPSMYVHTHMF